MAITLRTSVNEPSSPGGVSATRTLTIPGTAVVGELLVLTVYGQTGTSITSTPAGSWSLAGSVVYADGFTGYVYYKYTESGDIGNNLTVTANNAAGRLELHLDVFTGANGYTPTVLETASTASGMSVTWSYNTALGDPSLVMQFLFGGSTSTRDALSCSMTGANIARGAASLDERVGVAWIDESTGTEDDFGTLSCTATGNPRRCGLLIAFSGDELSDPETLISQIAVMVLFQPSTTITVSQLSTLILARPPVRRIIGITD